MAAITEESAGQDHRLGLDDSDVAVRRVTAYFHSLGLPLEHAGEAAGRMVREIRGQQERARGSGDGAAEAVNLAMTRVDEWLDRLAESCPDPRDDLRAQLKWYLRPVLRRHPESLLQTRDLPEELHRAIQDAARPILPPALPAVMPAQSFGGVPRLGQRIVAYAGLIPRRLAHILWGMWK